MAVKRFYFFGSYSSAPAFRPFIMEVESDGNGVFTIPTTGGGYNYDVKTSDGQVFTGVTGNLTITFPSPNTRYDVEFYGLFPRFHFANGSERLKAKDIKQWGDIEWGANQTNAFYGCADMTCSALDSPNLTLVTNGQSMFRGSTSFNPPNFAPTLENMTNGSYMFNGATSFNPPNFAPTLGSLTNGQDMFNGATSFNPPNFAPTLENLTNGYGMFYRTLIDDSNVAILKLKNLINGAYMFGNTPNLEHLDTSEWDVSGVTNFNAFLQQNPPSNFSSDIDFSDPITGSISLTDIRGMMAGTESERLLLQAGNLQSPTNIAGNPSNWIASPNMKEVKLFGMKNDVDTTIGLGSAGAMTGEAWLDLLESFDISQASIYKLSPTAYSDMETHLQGLGYIDIADYLTQTNNNWTVIN